MSNSIRIENEPSKVVQETLDYNEDEIYECARVAALQAMPICLAQGQNTTLKDQIELLSDAIKELIRRVIEEGEGFITETVAIYKIEVCIGEHFGDGISDKAKNLYQLDVDISIPLEWTSFHFHPSRYREAKKLAKTWFHKDAVEDPPASESI